MTRGPCSSEVAECSYSSCDQPATMAKLTWRGSIPRRATAHQEFHGFRGSYLIFSFGPFRFPDRCSVSQCHGMAPPPNVPSQKGCDPAPQSHHPLAGRRCVPRRGAAPRLPTASGFAVLVTGAPLLCALFLQEGGRAGLGGDSKGCRAVDYPSRLEMSSLWKTSKGKRGQNYSFENH